MQFTEFLDKMTETHPDVDVSLKEEHTSDLKRPLPSGASPDAKKKKLDDNNIDPAHIVPSGTDENVLVDMSLVGLKAGTGKLLVLQGHKIRLVNTGENESMELSVGTILAGFGRGKWIVKEDGYDEEKDILYSLSGYEEKVLHGTDLLELLDVVNQKRTTNPDCRVAYHDMTPIPPSGSLPLGAFKLDVTKELAFRPLTDVERPEAAKGHLQTRLASTIPVNAWDGNYSKLIWTLKWSANGLTPVRPQIVLTKNVTIAPGKSLLLN